MLIIYLCTTFIKRIISNLICPETLYMSDKVQCTLYKIDLQMYVLFVKLLATVESGSARPEVRGTAEPHGGAYPP